MTTSKVSPTHLIWDKDLKEYFCDVCVKEVEAGNRPTTFFNKEGWLHIAAILKERTGSEFTKTQLKNKWDNLKKNWKLWKELKQGSTGLGWNPIKKTIDASDEWWKEKLEVLPDAKKFRLAGIAPEMEEKLDVMFGGAVSTGSNAWGTAEGGLDLSEGHADCEGTEQSHDLDENVPLPPVGTSQSSGTKRPRPSHPVLHSRKKGTAKVILEQVSGLLDVCTNMSIGDQRHIDAPSIGTTIGELYTMPEIGPNKPLLLFSIAFLEQPSKREIFVALTYEDKVAYLRREYEKELRQEFHNTSRASSSRGG